MEKDDTCEEQLEAAGGEALSNADKRKFAEEQYERALKETEAQGEARRKSVGRGGVVCRDRGPARRRGRAREVDGSGLRRSARERWSDVLEACADREDLDARVVACAVDSPRNLLEPKRRHERPRTRPR